MDRLDKINYQYYKVLLSLINFSEEKEKELLEFCKNHNNIVYVLKTVGSWDMEIELEVHVKVLLESVQFEAV